MLIMKIFIIFQLFIIINSKPINVFEFLLNFTNTTVQQLNLEADESLFPVTIIHFNDFHSHFEETNYDSGICKPEQNQKCIGGYARVVTMVKHLMSEQSKNNPIFLNAGDNFVGTLWYSYLKGDVVTRFLNILPADAMTIGNHDFDDKINGLIPFLTNISSPIVLSNMDDSQEPRIQGLYNKSVVITRYNRKIGVIGVLLEMVGTLVDIENLKFNNEIESIKSEARNLENSGVDIIIVLSHCGLDIDRNIAKNVDSNIDVIIGGHTHTFMYTGENPPGPDLPRAEYPEIIIRSDGHQIPIVQASSYTKYLGNLTLWFNQQGKMEKYSGAPIFLDELIEPDPDILNEMKFYKEIIEKKSKEFIAINDVDLITKNCFYGDCAFGNLVADSILDEMKNCSISFLSNTGIRISLPKGNVTYGDLKVAFPFDNTFDSMEIKGKYLLSLFDAKTGEKDFNDLQVGGVRILSKPSNPPGMRLISVDVRCHDCDDVVYHPLDPKKIYQICTFSYFADGYNNYDVIRDNKINQKTGTLDVEIIASFMKKISPITYESDGRITLIS